MRDKTLKNAQAADALSELFQHLRISEEINPTADFYGRVLDRIAIERQSNLAFTSWLPLATRVAIVGLIFACSALMLIVQAETSARSYDAVVAALTSNRPEDQRDAVLSQFLTYAQRQSALRPAQTF